MYYMIKGKGCENCPFYQHYENGSNEMDYWCALKSALNYSSYDCEDAWYDVKPHDCPFRTGESIEIWVEEEE